MFFRDESFLLSGPVARDLYHRVAARQPIVDSQRLRTGAERALIRGHLLCVPS